MTDGRIVSRHFFRRTARAAAHHLNEVALVTRYEVRRAVRGPYRWYVVEVVR